MRRVGGEETKRHVLVDGNNLIYRAYYAYVESRIHNGKPLLSGPGGYPTGVVYGSLSMLSSWLYSISDITKISVFFDGYPKRRKTIYPEYKANRDSTSNSGLRLTNKSATVDMNKKLLDGYEASGEVDILSHIFSLLGCDVYHHPEEEADDLIASFCKLNQESIRFIISSDKDFFQLLTDNRIICYIPGVDGGFYDAEKSTQRWAKMNKGKHPAIPPSSVRMFKTLCGDSSDGIFGISRLRKKVAANLCQYANIDDLYKGNLNDMSSSERENLLSSVDKVRLNYELVGLNDFIDLSTCIRETGKDNFTVATSILNQDLGISHMDISPFKLGTSQVKMNLSSSLPETIPMDAWLREI